MPQPHIVAQPGTDISLEEKLAFLHNPSCYPQCVFKIETIETHMSWVFLTDENAYKLKKPVRHDIFDFRSIEARKHFCEEEVRLNRRLAEDVYLAVLLSEARRNRRVLGRTAYQLPADRIRRLCDWHRSMLRICPHWLEERMHGTHIVEGHGDLRPEHVCIRERSTISLSPNAIRLAPAP